MNLTLDQSEFNVLFVHSALDDLGLTPEEFRVYCHLARRASGGQAWPSKKSIAQVCAIHLQTVEKVLKALETYRMVRVVSRQGQGLPNLYSLTKQTEWMTPDEIDTLRPKRGKAQGVPETNRYPSESGTRYKGVPISLGQGVPETNGQGVPETNRYEGYPIRESNKEIQKEEKTPPLPPDGGTPVGSASPEPEPKTKRAKPTALDLPIPDRLNTPEFREAWTRWLRHRTEIKKPLTQTSAQTQLSALSDWGVARAVAAINHTVLSGWQGLREPNPPPPPRTGPGPHPTPTQTPTRVLSFVEQRELDQKQQKETVERLLREARSARENSNA